MQGNVGVHLSYLQQGKYLTMAGRVTLAELTKMMPSDWLGLIGSMVGHGKSLLGFTMIRIQSQDMSCLGGKGVLCIQINVPTGE